MPRLAPGLIAAAALASVAATATGAEAHKPSYSQGLYASAAAAYFIEDPDVSIVLYHQVTCEAPILWMAFDATEPRDLFVQLGVPELDRLADYRPSLAVLAPGLPALAPDDVPFDVPDGLGGVVLRTDDVTEPAEFFEPFSSTYSEVLVEETLALPEAGAGFVVAWHPGRQTGKLWVAVGTEERFGPEDFEQMAGWLADTREFHESGADEPAPAEIVCPVDEEAPDPTTDDLVAGDAADAAGDTGPQPATDAGCGSAPSAPAGWHLGLLVCLLVAGRRRVRPPRGGVAG